MSDTTKLRRKDVKKEVKRIKKLPEYERERQMKSLHKRVNDVIHSTSARIVNDQNSYWGFEKEAWRLLFCVMVFPKDYRRSIYKIWNKAFTYNANKAFTNNVNYTSASNAEQIVKTKTAHVSGLPLPEQAEVYVWWQDDMLILASTATEFSLPVERVMGMGTTWESRGSFGSQRTYLTIEYKKGDRMKYIVVRLSFDSQARQLINYFDQIKGARKANKQEL